MQTVRLFIAAELPDEITCLLTAAQIQLRRGNPPVKWVAPEAMHLTLRFLGETVGELLPQIGQALHAALAEQPAMVLQLTSAGAFPNLRRPTVLWAGIANADTELQRAVTALERTLQALGLPPEERPFRAHLTLGRVHREATPTEQERLGASIRALPPFTAAPWPVERVVLFRSELRGAGPIYTELDSVTL